MKEGGKIMIKETRKFNGLTYKFVMHYYRKVDAKEAQSRLRKKGHFTRITQVKGATAFKYQVWARRK